MSCHSTTVMEEQRCVQILSGATTLTGVLDVPMDAEAVIVFANGSGSRRPMAATRKLAERLRRVRLATLLIDLIPEQTFPVDDQTIGFSFDVRLLASRLRSVIEWLTTHDATRDLQVGLFATSTATAASLITAAHDSTHIGAIVSYNGRPDLAGHSLVDTACPTLLIVGGDEHQLIALNRQASDYLHGEKDLLVLPGLGDDLAERAARDIVSQLTVDWFTSHLRSFQTSASR